MMISPNSGWKKVEGKCCLTILGGITKLTIKTHTSSIGYVWTYSALLRFDMQSILKTSLV
jgi:hypothetical protein